MVWNYNVLLLLRLPHHFPLMYGVDVSYEKPPLNYSSSLLNTCPYNINLLLSCTFLDDSPTFAVPQIILFLILYGLVTPFIYLNILIFATSNFFSCAFFNGTGTIHHCWSYNRLVYFPLILKLILRSHRIPDTLFQLFHPDCILCVISASKSPFSSNVAPRYLNVFTLSKFSPCRLISEFPSKFPSPLNLR